MQNMNLSMMDEFYILMALVNFIEKDMAEKDKNNIKSLIYRFLIGYKGKKFGIIKYMGENLNNI